MRCGIFFINASDTAFVPFVYYGAALVYQNRNTLQCYSFRGGRSGVGSWSGLFYYRIAFLYSAASWDIGAALSYQNRNSLRYAMRGGRTPYSDSCGLFHVSLSQYDLSTNWGFGAALSYRKCVLSKSK